MQVPASMILVATLVVAAGAAVITPANAADAQLSDAAYIQAARCAGLAQGSKMDTRHVDTLLDRQQSGRMDLIMMQSQDARDSAAREVRQATGPMGKMQVSAEIDSCRSYLGDRPSVVGVAAQ